MRVAVNRREWLAGVGALAAASALRPLDAGMTDLAMPFTPGFPRKADFALPGGMTFLNAAYTHPMPLASSAAIARYAQRRTRTDAELPDEKPVDLKAEFAALINAKPSEISFIPNTSTGENMIVNALGIPRFDGNVVTDGLHFDGALVHLMELQKAGLDLRMVMPRENRIEMRDLEKVVDGKTKLIEVSLVAMYNGFQHDLATVCDLAHAHGALVYADIVQAAGAVPIDVRTSNVDFCACSSFKWLMGDFGTGFLYVREDLLERMPRTMISYHNTSEMDGHYGPFDPLSATTPVSWTMRADATGHFEVASTSHPSEAAVKASLPYIRSLGVANIQAYRQPLLERIRGGMTQLGFTPATPEGTTSPIITFAMKDGKKVADKLKRAKVSARVSDDWIRLSPSIYNDTHDVDRLLEALS
jgi:selenocysteine lyase/cysteine desulfurase